jgi:hypothetical protein
MLFNLTKRQISGATLALILSVSFGLPAIAANNVKKPRHNKLYLVPPPPPYVPSMLPELSRYRGYQSYYSNSTSKAGSSPILYKPNKYLTYCYSSK